ncbi:hypothetical protein [Candidatus Palauibacter sp.]|uniref:hypothetical protein n=1 Tax=Candidatus Palauibacter sp. TaxID=3101350 RepID=UPI003B02510B
MAESGFRRLPAAVFLALGAVSIATPGAGQDWRDFRSARQLRGVEALDVQLLYAGGSMRVSPSEATLLYDAQLRYDADHLVPRRDWRREGDAGRLRLMVSSRTDGQNDFDAPFRLDGDLELDLGYIEAADDAGRLAFALNPSVPTRLRVGVGAGRARLELGGMALTTLEFMAGAGDVRVGFARENRVPMELLSMKSGATGLVAEDLGNARFERMELFGVIGDVTLDFSGAWRASAEAEVRMALGELVMRVPREIGVRVTRSGLASLSAEGFRQEGDAWLSPNWESARVQLEITLAAGLGSVTVERD